MGGNNNHGGRANDYPFAKVKFFIPSFSGLYDVVTYLDWEMTVEQKFSSHLVLEQHKVQQATSDILSLPTSERIHNGATDRADFILKIHESTKHNIEKMNEKYRIAGSKGRKRSSACTR
jgi:hypothetical protein